MQPPQQHSWINLGEIKGQLIKKLGLERSKQYLDYLNLFLSFKLSKPEFDKLCLRTVGKDNIRLHNQLIRAVLKNACTRKVPTGNHDDPSRTVGNKKTFDGPYHQNGSIPAVTQVPIPLALANGDILPPSPRKARTGVRDRRIGDRKSALGPNGKTNYTSFSSSVPQSGPVLENGDSSSPDTRSAIQRSENGEKTESLSVSDRTSLHAPLGVPFCPASIGGASRVSPLASSSKTVSVLHTDGLLDTTTLKERMEQIVTSQGLQHVSMDCANVLNNGLDAYLKGLIRSCIQLNGSANHPTDIKSVNGVRPGHQSNNTWPLNPVQEHEPHPKRVVTFLDFRVAMELNHKQLGEDWPVILEKICTHDFEE